MSARIDKAAVIRYALLPGIWPRMRELFGSGFPHLSYLIANLFDMMRLLPPGHPYLNRGNFGRFSILDVLRSAAGELKPGWRNADKFIAFFTILAGMIMLVIQCALMLVALIVTPAAAQDMPTTYGGFFRTPYPKEDIAFRMMDLVFGIPGLFGMEENGSQPFHLALQALLEFYSYGLLFVGIFILLYIVVVLVAETAQTGIPFGKRFNHAWAPVRLVLFFGLLIPVTHGINGAQYIILLSAKAGSGLATNGWQVFNDNISDTYLGARETLVMKPSPPELSSLPAFIMIAKTCQKAVGFKHGKDVKAWVVVNNEAEELGTSTFQDITARTKDNIMVRFGEKNAAYTNEAGQVFPHCGEIFLYTSDIAEPGSAVIQRGYYDMVKSLWNGTPAGGNSGPRGGGSTGRVQGIGNDLETFAQSYFETGMLQKKDALMPKENYRAIWGKELQEYMAGPKNQAATTNSANAGLIGEAVSKQVNDGDFETDPEVMRKGWAGAAIWYNGIAKQNGALVTSVRNFPTPTLYPDAMEQVAKQKAGKEFFVDAKNKYSLSLQGEGQVTLKDEKDMAIAQLLNQVYQYWQQESTRTDRDAAGQAPTENIIIDAINLLFGTAGLFDMCRNADIHPLAQLSGLGKGLIESAIRGFATSAILGVGSGFLSLISPALGTSGYAASSFMLSIAGIGLMVGFILFYVLPFMPFLYFFFAAGGWLKGVFEAVIGAPLWALGHLRIDGEGIVGEAAKDGYFMALEIFLRPILILFGLLASLIIFSAMVKVLNDIFGLIISNLPAGSDGGTYCFPSEDTSYSSARGPIDNFFYTIVYAIVVYLIGNSSFKLIEGIPRSIMRWIGEDVAAFGDQEGDAAEGLVQRIAIGGAGMGERLEGGLGNATKSLKDGVGGIAGMAGNFMNPDK